MRKIKLTKTILKKIIKKRKKTIWGNTVVLHSVLKEKTIKLNSQTAQYYKK
jgi:hypothetical protein